MIPKILHQYWDGNIPEKYSHYMDSIKNMNPDFSYNLWNKESVCKIASEHQLIEYLKQAPKGIVSSDIARIILLDILGGIYLDSDMLSVQPIPEHILIHDCFACYENEYHLGQCIANGAVGSIQNAIFIKQLVKEISTFNIDKIRKIKSDKSYSFFGPQLWTKAFFDLDCYNIILYPSWYFIPYHYADHNKKTTGYITEHIWKNTYTNWFPANKQYAKDFIDRKFKDIEWIKT